MLTAHVLRGTVLERRVVRDRGDLTEDVRWLDLANPTELERQWIQEIYGQALLYMEDLGEIEASARFFRDTDGLHLQLYFLQIDNGNARNVNVGFIVNGGRLFTLHAADVTVLRTFHNHALNRPDLPDDALSIMMGIDAARVALLADTFERLHSELESLSAAIFSGEEKHMPRVLETLARIEDMNGKARLGMVENRRGFSAFALAPEGAGMAEQCNELMRDVESLMTHSNYLFEKVKFLLDSALGMIDIQHSKRLGIFTVLSVVLMPPTLIASIYGMNFKHMPELDWLVGYPLALLLMLAVALGPIIWLKRRDWL
jgi:magnesium transporter